jgi:hypothetical protein
MDATRILPDLQCSLLCEDIRQEATATFTIVGVIDVVRVPQTPIVAFKLALFNRWTAGIGVFTETVRMIAPDQTTVLRKSEMKFQMRDAYLNATNVTVMQQVEFKTPGVYFIEILVDDVMKLRYPVPVVVVTPPNAPGQAHPPGPAPGTATG